ncbi:cadherin-like beta sandwich domain-containing protein [Paenibacillus sp. SC116]|uniref:cadherin-like beta sandwich domain-containing protein n=1 Tax=Paenibacillus sp. SC116 TaxID=2968986 RepID=UPI00215AAB52|nr:cadherin-like beta sandwich domain-containing protein [Paenibacillus sp. SC116]MCR8846359.1 cadherin-like beta sandwich domain-containing protein [Paenibacillus sp. SC116]
MRRRGNEIRFWRGVGIVLLSFAIILTGSIGPWNGNVQAASSWVPHISETTKDINNIAYGNGRWVGVANQGQIIMSTDGVSWSMQALVISPQAVLYAGNQWVIVGDAGKMYTSVDGETWIQKTTNVSDHLRSIAHNGSIYVVVGANGTILTSSDGNIWTARKQGATSLNAVTYGGGKFVAVGEGGRIYTSVDGLHWVPVASPTAGQLLGVTYADSKYVVVGINGLLLTSSDGSTWTQQTSPFAGMPFFGVAYGGNKFIAVGDSIISSSDGVNWVPEDPGSPHYFNHIAFGNGRFIAVGENGRLVSQLVPLSNNANLSNLVLSAGTLSPTFTAGTTNYTANVANGVTELDVTPTITDSKARVTVNGAAVASGSASRVSLNVGANMITIVVTAEDGTSKTYTVTVTRAVPKSSNADLNNLTLSAGTLSPVFASGTTSYTANVANSVTALDVTPSVADSKASVTVNGAVVASGSASRVPLNVGANLITVVVTAENGTPKTYTVTVTRAKSSNADLSSLTLSAGTLSPAFASGTTSYTANVASGVTELDLTLTVADSKATVTVNGAAVSSGSASRVSLNVGANPLTVVVTAEDGTPKTYTVTVTRAVPKSSNADLSSLTLSAGTLSPAFASGTTSYTANVASSVTELDVTPTVADSKATVTVNGAAVASGSASRVSLNVGANPITVVVTAEDGTPKTYTVTVTRAVPLSSNANLSNLALSAGTLSPAFVSGTTSYTANVASSVTELDLTLTVADSKATLTVNGAAVASGSASRVALNVGANPITIVVTAEDGTPKTYTVTVTRAVPKSSNADLSSLVLSAGTLSPAFVSGTTSYTANVASSVTELDVTPSVADSKASVTVNGAAVASGSASRVSLNVGANTITVVVTAEDGTPKTYTVTVTRAVPLSSNADLSNLVLSAGTLSPTFTAGTMNYTANVASGVTGLDVTPTVADSKATVTVNGAATASGSAARAPLNVGANPITIVVTAEDGTPKTYTVTVTRAVPKSSNADLSNLTLSAGTLSPAFASGTTSYTANVASSVTELDVTPTVVDSKASVTVNGAAVAGGSASRVSLNVGANPITIVVTAEDGTPKTYTVIVTRAVPKSSNADLSNLALSAGTLSPTFVAGTTHYTASVTDAVYDVNVTATAADAAAKITINGTGAANGTAVKVPLNIGANAISILVTAQDGTTKTYTVTVTRSTPPQSNNTDLSSLTLSTGTLSPSFSSGTTNYTATVTNAVYEINVSALAKDDKTATITINGAAAANGSAVKVALKVGANPITILVTAQDGSSKLYSVTLTREAPASNGGSNGGHTPEDSKGSIQVIDADGTILQVSVGHLIGANLPLSADIYDSTSNKQLQQGIVISSDGTFTFKPLSTGTYRVYLFVTSANGERLAGTEGELVVHSSDKAVMKVKAIDPFSIVRDAKTQQPIAGAKVSLYWADTELNKRKGRVPGTQVVLPRIEAEKLSYNENVQYSDTEGQLGWLLFPEGDYYVIAEKEGFKTYDSRKEQSEQSIHVKNTAVKLDIRMINEAKEHVPYILGYKDGTFRPNQGITRAELASILARLFLQAGENKQQTANVAFTDVEASHWASKHITAVAQSKLMIGDKNGQFHPEQIVTRAEIAIIVSKLKQLKNSSAYQLSFTDVKGHWAEEYIKTASEANLLKGFPDGTYRPQQSLTRAQVVVLINKILGRTASSIDALPKWKDVHPTYWAYDAIMEASTAHRYVLKDGQEVWLKQ